MASADAVVLSTELQALCEKAKILKFLTDFFLSKEFVDPLDISLLGDNESEVLTLLRNAIIPGADWDDFTLPVKVKKLYIFVRLRSRLTKEGVGLPRPSLRWRTMNRYQTASPKQLRPPGLRHMDSTSMARGC